MQQTRFSRIFTNALQMSHLKCEISFKFENNFLESSMMLASRIETCQSASTDVNGSKNFIPFNLCPVSNQFEQYVLFEFHSNQCNQKAFY